MSIFQGFSVLFVFCLGTASKKATHYQLAVPMIHGDPLKMVDDTNRRDPFQSSPCDLSGVTGVRISVNNCLNSTFKSGITLFSQLIRSYRNLIAMLQEDVTV